MIYDFPTEENKIPMFSPILNLHSRKFTVTLSKEVTPECPNSYNMWFFKTDILKGG